MTILFTRPRRVHVAKRVHPRQRAIFSAAGKISRGMAKYLLDELVGLRGDASLDRLARLMPNASDDEIYSATGLGGARATFVGLGDFIRQGLGAGSATAAKELGSSVVLDMGAPKIGQWLQSHSAEFVSRTIGTSIESIRAKIEEGVMMGRHPARLAKDIQSSIGLTGPQSEAVSRSLASNLAAGMSEKRAFAAADRYSERLLRQRSMTIATHESMTAINKGRSQLWGQLAADFAIWPEQEQEWLTSEDEATCPICAPMNGQRAKLGEEFQAGDGTRVTAPPVHVRCRCTVGLL